MVQHPGWVGWVFFLNQHKYVESLSADPLRLQGERVREGTSAQGVEGSSMVCCVGAHGAAPEMAPQILADVWELWREGTSLETCQKGLARGMFFYGIRKRR